MTGSGNVVMSTVNLVADSAWSMTNMVTMVVAIIGMIAVAFVVWKAVQRQEAGGGGLAANPLRGFL